MTPEVEVNLHRVKCKKTLSHPVTSRYTARIGLKKLRKPDSVPSSFFLRKDQKFGCCAMDEIKSLLILKAFELALDELVQGPPDEHEGLRKLRARFERVHKTRLDLDQDSDSWPQSASTAIH